MAKTEPFPFFWQRCQEPNFQFSLYEDSAYSHKAEENLNDRSLPLSLPVNSQLLLFCAFKAFVSFHFELESLWMVFFSTTDCEP